MKIVLGSTSQDKKDIMEEALLPHLNDFEIILAEVDSGIKEQPLGQDQVVEGAKNRAREALKKFSGAEFSLGLEGGLEKIDGNFFLICAAVIHAKGKYFTGLGSKLALPVKVSQEIDRGGFFGKVIREFKEENKNNESLLLLVNSLISREELFTEAIRNAYLAYLNIKFF